MIKIEWKGKEIYVKSTGLILIYANDHSYKDFIYNQIMNQIDWRWSDFSDSSNRDTINDGYILLNREIHYIERRNSIRVMKMLSLNKIDMLLKENDIRMFLFLELGGMTDLHLSRDKVIPWVLLKKDYMQWIKQNKSTTI